MASARECGTDLSLVSRVISTGEVNISRSIFGDLQERSDKK